MMGFPQRGEGNLTRATSLCKNFQPNMFNKTKCQNCFRTREAHDLDGGNGSNKPKKVLLCGYLFIAPGLDPENPMSRSRKWQRRCFILYENGELAYALDDSINTVPQGVINMYQCSTVFNADTQTGQKFSLGIQTTKQTTFIRAETREEKDSWLETLAEYPAINKENERLKQRQMKLAAQHAAREEKYGKLKSESQSTKSEPSSKNELNQSWPKTTTKEEVLKELDQPKVNDSLKRSQSSVDARSRYSDQGLPLSYMRSTSMLPSFGVDQQDNGSQPLTSKRKNEIPSSLSSKSIRSDEAVRSAPQARQPQDETPADMPSSRSSRMRSRVRASDSGISELSKSGAAMVLGIQKSRSDIGIDRSAYAPQLHQNNNNVNSDLPAIGSRSDPQRRSWRLRSTQEQPLTELPSPQEKSPKEVLPPTTSRAEDSGAQGRERSSTTESQTSTVSTGSQSSDDFERLDNPKKSGLRVNKAMLDGDSPSPSKRTIERRKHANNRRSRHTVTIDSSMHVIPSSDESETNKDTPTLKRSSSDPNLADSDDMLKRKQIAMTFPGLFHLKKGWLIKQGDGEQDWSKHWFVLCDNKLSYYKDSSDEDPNSLDGVIELAKCNEASETPVNRNYGFQIELDTGVIILAAMTSGIRNNWVGAINKAIKTAREDIAKKTSEPTSVLKENQPLVAKTNKPNSLPLSKSTSDVPREERSSPLQPARKSLNNVDLIPPSSRMTQIDNKTSTLSPVESKQPLERRSSSQSQSTKTSPLESLPPHSGKPEGRCSSVTKAPESRPRRGSVPKEGTTHTEARRNSVTKEPGGSPDSKKKNRDRSSSDSTKPKEKSKEKRGRRGSRSEKRSQEDTAAAVTAALSKRTSNTDSKQSTSVRKSRSSSQSEEPATPSSSSEQDISPRSRTDSENKKQPATVDTTVMSLLEQEVDTLKAQLEQKQQDCIHLQHENVDLKARLNSEQRDHKESFQDFENEQSGFMTQIEQMEKTNQKLQAELRQSKNSTHELQQQNQQLGSKFSTLQVEAQGRDHELANLKARFEDIVRDLTVTRSNLKEERERSETLETELTDTWTKLRESGQEAVDVDVIERMSLQLDEARARLEKSESLAIEKEENREERLSGMQSQYQLENAALQKQLQAALDENNKLQSRLTEQSEQVEKAESAVLKAGQTDKPSPETNVRVTELEATVQKLKSQLKAEVTTKSEVQKKYDELVAQSAHQFLEGQGDMASTGSDDHALRLETELDLAGRELDKLKKERTLLEQAFEREQARRKQLEESTGESTQESGSSKVGMEQKNSEIASIREELKKAKKEREAVNLVRKQLVTAVDKLNSKLTEKDRKIETLSAEVETRGSQNSELEQQLQTSLSKGLNLQSHVEKLEADLKQASEKKEAGASVQLEALQSEHRQLKRQMGTLEEQHALEMHNRQSEMETAGDRINSLQDKVAELETKLKSATERATRIEDDAAASILDMQKEEELLRSKCERGEKEVKRLRGELHAAQDNYDELEFQFITQREDLKRMEQERGKEIGQMGYRIQDLTNKLAAAERKVRDLRGVDHRNRAKGGVGAAGGMGMQLTQTRQMENKLKELESKLGDVESTLQNQDQDTTSLLGKIVSVEQQVQARAQLLSTSSVSSLDAEHPQFQAVQSLSRGSSAASAPCDSVSTSGADLSEDSEPAETSDRTKQTFRARFLETKLSETELKLKEVTRKLVDVTTRELENRKAYQGKSVSESRLKEKLKVMEREVEAVTKELQQVQSNSRTFACAMRAALTDCGQLLGDINSGIEWVDLEVGLDRNAQDGLQRVEVATNPTTSHANMLSCLKSLLTDACHKIDQCKQTAISQQTHIEKQSRESLNLSLRERSGEGNSAGSSFTSTTVSSFESTEFHSSESGSTKPRKRNPSVIGTLERFANRLSAEVILLGESTFLLRQTDWQKLAKVQMCLRECESLTTAMTELETALGSEHSDTYQSTLTHTSQTVNDLLSPRHLLQAEACYNQAPPKNQMEGSKSQFGWPLIDRHSKSRSPLKKQKRTNTPVTYSKSVERSSVWTPKLDNFANSLANTVIKAGQVEYLSNPKKGVNVVPSVAGNDVFSKLRSSELKLEEVASLLQHKQNKFSEVFDGHLKRVIQRLSEILAQENNRRVRSDKERNRKAGLCVDDNDVFGGINDIVSLAAKDVDIARVLKSVGQDLVSFAKQIALQEARGMSVSIVEDKMLLVEVFHLLQVRVTDFLKKVSLERSTCQVVLRALSDVGKKRYSCIEILLEEQLFLVKEELIEGYQNAVAELREGKGVAYGDDVDLHTMLGDYVGLLGSLMIRKVVVEGLVRHIQEQMPPSCNSEIGPLNGHDVSLDLVAGSLEHTESEPVISRIPEPVSAEYENMAINMADAAIERAEMAHLSSQLQDEWEQIMQKGRYSPIAHITSEHARNMVEVRRRYETQLKAEELQHELEFSSLQKKYKEALVKVEELEMKLQGMQVRRASKPEITLTLEEDLNDTLDDLVATRLGEILDELESTRDNLTQAKEEMATAEKEHVKEVDAITDVMENMKHQYQTEIETLKTAHREMVSDLERDFQDRLEQLKKQHLREMAQLKRQQVNKSLQRETTAASSLDKMGQARNNGDLVLQEKSHREILEEIRRLHNQEIKALEEEKDKELEEERKATSITIAMLKNTYREELEKERQMLRQLAPKGGTPPLLPPSKKEKKISKTYKRATGIAALHKAHKHELEQQRADMQQNVSNDVEVVMKRHREVITKMDQEWKIISDKFTHVCAENVALKKQAETLEKGLAATRKEMESWKAQVRQLVGQKAEDMAALRERRGGRGGGRAGNEEEMEGEQDDWGVDGNDNEKNPLQVLLRFREAELQCTNNEINQLSAALEDAEKQRTKAVEQNVFLEGQHQSQEEHIKQLLLALEELQHQVEIVRTSGEGQAAQDQIQEMIGAEGSTGQHNPAQGSGDTKQDVKLRSWLPFLKRERSESTGKGSRRRTGSDGNPTAKLKKGASTTE